MEIGHPLAAYRKARGLTQRDLANLLGVARETVARWECGRKIPAEITPSIAEKTGIAPASLRPDLADTFKRPEAAE